MYETEMVLLKLGWLAERIIIVSFTLLLCYSQRQDQVFSFRCVS
jgi:hypothetical protein